MNVKSPQQLQMSRSKVNKAVELNHFNKYIKLLHSFNSDRNQYKHQNNIIKHKKNISSYSDQTNTKKFKPIAHTKSISRSLTKNLTQQSEIDKQKKLEYKIPCLQFLKKDESKLYHKAKSTGILQKNQSKVNYSNANRNRFQQFQVFLPSIKQKINNRANNKNTNRPIKTLPSLQHSLNKTKKLNCHQKTKQKTKQSKFYLKKLEGNVKGNLIQFYKMKPTQRYFEKLKNIQIAQKLLLAQPSKQLRKSQHKKFWSNQKSYRKQISRSQNMLLQTSRTKNARSRIKKAQQMWKD